MHEPSWCFEVNGHWWIQWGKPAKTNWKLLECPELEYTRNQLYVLYLREYIARHSEHPHPNFYANGFPCLSKLSLMFHLSNDIVWSTGTPWLRTGHWSRRLLEKHAGKQLQLPRLLDPIQFLGFLLEKMPQGLMWTERDGKKYMGKIII